MITGDLPADELGRGARPLVAARSLRSNTAWMTGAYGVSYITQGVYFLVLARSLHAGGLGEFAAALAVVNILVPFSDWGGGMLLVRNTSRDPDAFGWSLGDALLTALCIGTAAVLLIAFVAGHLLTRTSGLQAIVPLAVAELIFGKFSEISAQAFQARENLAWSAVIASTRALTRVVALFALLRYVTHPTAGAWAIGYIVAAIVAGAGALLLVRLRLGAPTWRSGAVRRVLGSGGNYALGQSSKTVYDDVDKAMVTRFASNTAGGAYTAADRLLSMAFAPVLAFLYASNTRMFRDGGHGAARLDRFVRRGRVRVAVYGVGIGCVAAVCAPLVPRVLGASYAATVPCIRIMACLPLLQGMHALYGDAIMGLGRQGLRSVIQLSVAVGNVLVNLVVIPRWSYTGAAVVTIVTELVLLAGVGAVYHYERGAEHALQPVAA